MIVRCVVCNRKLHDPESRDKGVGSQCEKRLDRETLIEIRNVIRQGWQPRIIGNHVISLNIPETEGEHPE